MKKFDEFLSGKMIIECENEREASNLVSYAYENGFEWIAHKEGDGNRIFYDVFGDNFYLISVDGKLAKCFSGFSKKVNIRCVKYKELKEDKEILIKVKTLEEILDTCFDSYSEAWVDSDLSIISRGCEKFTKSHRKLCGLEFETDVYNEKNATVIYEGNQYVVDKFFWSTWSN